MISSLKKTITVICIGLLILSVSRLNAQNQIDTIVRLPVIEIHDTLSGRLIRGAVISSQKLSSSGISDIGEYLRGEPNISGIRRGGYAIDPVIRGFRYSQLNIFLDEGFHIEGGCPNRMDPVLSHIDPEFISRLEVVKGPYLLAYGQSPAASIRVNTFESQPFGKKETRIVSLTGYDSNRDGFSQFLSLKSSGSKTYLKLGAGLKNFGNYTDGNGTEWNSEFHKRSISAETGLKIADNQALVIKYIGSFGRDVLFPALAMDEIADNTNIFSGIYTRANPDRPENLLKISAYHTRVYHEMDNSFRPQYTQVVPPYTGLMQGIARVNTNATGLRLFTSIKRGNQKISAGFDTDYTEKDGTRNMKMIMEMDGQEMISEKAFNLWKQAWIFNTGVHGGLSENIRRFSYEIGFRADLNLSDSGDTLQIVKNDVSWFDVQPVSALLLGVTASGSYRISEKIKVTAGLARSARAPDLQERYIKFLATGYDKYDYLGNPALKPEINYQADLIAEYRDENNLAVITLFRSDVQNYITGTLLPPSVARPLSTGAPGVKQFNNLSRAVFYGFEAEFTRTFLERLTASASAGTTLAYSPETEKIILENGQATGTIVLKNDPIAEIPPFEAMVRASYILLSGRVKTGVSVRLVSAQKRISEASYEEATPGFALLNFSLEYQPVKPVFITIGGNNLLNKAYYEHLNRKVAGSTTKLYEPGRSFFVNLKISI